MEVHQKPRRGRERRRELGQTVMDSQNERRDGVEDDEIYLEAVTVSVEDAGGGRKRSPKVHWKPRDAQLRR